MKSPSVRVGDGDGDDDDDDDDDDDAHGQKNSGTIMDGQQRRTRAIPLLAVIDL
ncbi:hypothetical protein K0M31_020291 [Melipona bicolor]|uniref:Uncharacterized protein n=1 Tax=Melipona bicolor TaxID=60889 RepID=A0AA40KQL7_9HYME|nr:hypothetical protein K0M31_020291 [Melipona bicolor]